MLFKKVVLAIIVIVISGCTQITLTHPVIGGICNSVGVSDDRAINKDGLIYNDPIMGITTMEFSPPLAESVKRNICSAIETRSPNAKIEFSITELQCSGKNGVVEGYLRVDSNAEERVRAIATTGKSGVQIATVCGFAISEALESLAVRIAEIASKPK